ncbi:ferredoxin [Streptomyces sp. NPDC059455]|uniref:ferredoxin n=1 Tax=Streptomyces sp. NPDC059455 TaxID=3346837 RepID=UPI0036BFC858
MGDTSPHTWRVEVDSSSCIGSGMCESVAPAYFRLVDGRSQPMRTRVEQDDPVLEASENCPVEAILVHDERTGAVLAPRER